jgi:hypothetical protein
MADAATGRPGRVAQDAPEEGLPAIQLGAGKFPAWRESPTREAAIEQTPRRVEEPGTILRTSRA